MSKTLVKNNDMVIALLRDAFGNGISGNQERSLLYIREALHVAAAQGKVLADRNDVRKQQAFEQVNRDAIKAQESWPAFDHSKVQESIQHWATKGISLDTLPARETPLG